MKIVALFALSCPLGACSAVSKLVAAATGSCSGPVAINPSGSISGKTSGAYCKAPDGSVGNVYTLTFAQPSSVQVSLTPSGFQPWMGVFTADGVKISQTNTSPWRFKLFLGPGTYQVAVSPVGNSDGTFTLTTAPADISACTLGPGANVSAGDNGIAVKGAVITGTLTAADCGGGTYRTEGYNLAGSGSGSTWTLTLTSDQAASFGVFIGNSQVASKVLNAAGTVSLTVPGSTDPTFRVFVGGTPGSGTINYTLTVN